MWQFIAIVAVGMAIGSFIGAYAIYARLDTKTDTRAYLAGNSKHALTIQKSVEFVGLAIVIFILVLVLAGIFWQLKREGVFYV